MASPRVTYYRADIDMETGDTVIHRMRRVNCPEGYCETEEQARTELEMRMVAAANENLSTHHGGCPNCCESTVTHEDEIAVPHIDTIAANDEETSQDDESGTPNEESKVSESGVTNEDSKVKGLGGETKAVYAATVSALSTKAGMNKDGFIGLQYIAIQARMTRAKTRTYLDKLIKIGLVQKHPVDGCYRVL